MENRINRVEQILERHDGQIASLFSKVDDISSSLASIQKTLEQIKFFMLGGLGAFLLVEVGLIEAIKVAV